MAPPAHRPLLWKTAVALLLCVISVVHAAVSFTNDEYAIQAGKPFKLTWTGNKGPVTISLMNGPDADLQQVLVIASGYTGTSFTWTPPLTLPTDGYELEINDGVSTDYSARFQFQGSGGGGSALPTTTSTKQSPTSSTTPAATTTGKSPATVTETVTAPTASTAEPGSSSQNTAAQSNNSGDLSTGAKIGIGVGAGVGAILLVALLVLFIIRRRRRVEAAGAARIAADSAAPSDTAVTSPSYTFQSMSMSSPASELEPKLERPWGEVGNPMNRAELWGGGRRMDATELDV